MSDTSTTPPRPYNVMPWWAMPVMGYTLVLAFVAAVFFFRDPDNSKQLIIALVALTTTILGYYFGFSHGSTSASAQNAPGAPAPPPSAPSGPDDSQATADALNAAEALGLKTGATK